jgi:hypothetical protein
MRSVFFNSIFFAALLALQPVVQASVLKDHPGHWLGDLKIPGGPTLRLRAELVEEGCGFPDESATADTESAIPIQE